MGDGVAHPLPLQFVQTEQSIRNGGMCRSQDPTVGHVRQVATPTSSLTMDVLTHLQSPLKKRDYTLKAAYTDIDSFGATFDNTLIMLPLVHGTQ